MPETFAVETRGIGKPDYSKEVSSAVERAGLKLKYNESLKIFAVLFSTEPAYPYYPWVKPVLAAEAEEHLVDVETGQSTPYILPAGYTFELITRRVMVNMDSYLRTYLDGWTILGDAVPGGGMYWENNVVALSSVSVDPTAKDSHEIDFLIINRGTANLEGGTTYVLIQKAVGTPPFPTSKIAKCPFCGTLKEVPISTTKAVCHRCGKEFCVMDLSVYRGTQ